MQDLISRDALFINLDGMMAVSPTGYIHGDTVADMISDAPTVDAIPIEWIERYISENPLYQSDDFSLYMNDMFADWRKERT